MKIALFSLLLSFVVASTDAAGHSASHRGYIIDNQCINLCVNAPQDQSCAPDGINVFYQPAEHTGWCKLLKVCEDSGYVLLSENPDPVTGRHDILLEFSGDAAQAVVVDFIKKGTKGQFPLVQVSFDDNGMVRADNVTLATENVKVQDTWASDDTKYTGKATHQVECLDSLAPDVATNNLCFRSDVQVTESGDYFTIESNGCPDHVSMQGSKGIISNTQPNPTPNTGNGGSGCNACCSGCGSCGSCGSCGTCGSCGACGSGCGASCAAGPKNIEIDWRIQPYENISAQVGDTITFSYQPFHDVAIYKDNSCDDTGSILLAGVNDSPFVYTLSDVGTLYFVCAQDGHCLAGQKFAVEVKAKSGCSATGNCGSGGCYGGCSGSTCGVNSCSGGCSGTTCGVNTCSGGCSGSTCGAGCSAGCSAGCGACGAGCSAGCSAGGCYAGCGANRYLRSLAGHIATNSTGCSASCGAGGCNACSGGSCGSGCGGGCHACGGGCQGSCSGTGNCHACSGGCQGSCSGTGNCHACSGGCQGSCSGNCHACSGGCQGSCSGTGNCHACSGGCQGSCSGNCCAGCTGAGCNACTGCGSNSCGNQGHSNQGGNDITPRFQHYTMTMPKNPGTPGEPKYFTGDDVIGLTVNGVLIDAHQQTWSYDSCVGHSDAKNQYHYHLPPFCMLKAMGLPSPTTPDWWINDAGTEVRAYADMPAQFPSSSSTSPVIGFARDGFPIFGPYDDQGTLMTSSALDECNGKVDSAGNYGYYMTVDPPFAPPCLRGKKGVFSYTTTNKVCPAQGIDNTLVTQTEIVSNCEGIPFETALDCADGGDGEGKSGVSGKQAMATILTAAALALA